MIGLTLHPMKEIRIVVQGEHLKFVTDLLDRVGATGYTIINNVFGKGHHGFNEGHLLFNGYQQPGDRLHGRAGRKSRAHSGRRGTAL